MQRMIVPASLLTILVAVFALYTVKYDTRRLQVKVRQAERAIERAEREIDVLKAERAHLARPARIEALARRLGMAPVSPDQIGRLSAAPLRSQRPAAAAPRALPGRR